MIINSSNIGTQYAQWFTLYYLLIMMIKYQLAWCWICCHKKGNFWQYGVHLKVKVLLIFLWKLPDVHYFI